MTTPTPRRPAGPRSDRADARRNYQRLVAAANDAFSEHGVSASLEDIARRAGLGSATLHRHFPTRESLMAAVYWQQVEALCAKGRELLDTPSPGEALVAWLRTLIDLAARRGLPDALRASLRDGAAELFTAWHTALGEAGTPLLVRAQQAGAVRPDVELSELLTLANAIALATEQLPDRAERADRLLTLTIDGIRQPLHDG